MLNDEIILTITSGKLNEVDNFIINNNIHNVEELYDYISHNIEQKLRDDCIEFVIQYKYDGEIKTKPIVYKKELMNFRNCSNQADYIYKVLSKDTNFKEKFDTKYISELLNVNKKNSILTSASDYLHKFSYKTFSRLYNSLISRKKQTDLNNKVFETSEDLEYALNERKYSYTKQRNMYFDTYFWKQELPKTRLIVNNYEKEDEFDDQMKNDINFSEGLRVNGIPYQKFIEHQESIADTSYEQMDEAEINNVKKHVKRKKIVDPNQIHFFH